MWVCSALLLAGGVLAAVFVSTPTREEPAALVGDEVVRHRRSCPVDGPPIDRCPRHGAVSVEGEAA
jgi:hypothetical protein